MMEQPRLQCGRRSKRIHDARRDHHRARAARRNMVAVSVIEMRLDFFDGMAEDWDILGPTGDEESENRAWGILGAACRSLTRAGIRAERHTARRVRA